MEDPIGRWLLLALFALLAFLFKLLKTALSEVNDARLRPRAGKRLNALLDAPRDANRALSLLRSLSLVLLSGASVYFLANTPGEMLLAALILTFVETVFLKLIPSRIGERYADALVEKLCALYALLAVLMKPLTFVNEWIMRVLTKPFGEAPREEVTEEEIRAMVDIGEERGAIEGAERDMIENVFDFGDLTAEDCMTHRTDMTALSVDDDEREICATIEDSGLSRFPVYDEDIDDVIGVLFARDYLLNVAKPPKEKKPLRALLRDPYFVPETVKAETLLRNMQHAKTHMAIVVDEYGGVCGLVTMEDLLEEIVGDIYDEFDPADEAEIKQLAPDTYRVSGSATLDAINEALGVNLTESEDYDTLGGLFLSRFSEIPEDGTTPETDVYVTDDLERHEGEPCDTLHIKVEKLTDRRVESALVTKGRYAPEDTDIEE